MTLLNSFPRRCARARGRRSPRGQVDGGLDHDLRSGLPAHGRVRAERRRRWSTRPSCRASRLTCTPSTPNSPPSGCRVRSSCCSRTGGGRLRRAAHRAPGQSPAQRPRRRGRGTEPVPGGRRPRDRRLFARRQPDLQWKSGARPADVLLMSGGAVATRDDIMVAGYHVSTPAIDIHDRRRGRRHHRGRGRRRPPVRRAGRRRRRPGSGLLREGRAPPTVTDAQLVLGRLRPGKSAGGTLDLDLEAAPRGNPVGGRRAARTLDRRGRGRHR